MANFSRDLRSSLRQMPVHPSFTLIVVATMSLSIGIATTIFSLFDAILLRPFPYREPQYLVRVRTFEPKVKNSIRDASVYDFQDWRDRNRSFERMAAYISFTNQLTGRGPAQSVRMTFCSSSFFDVLGVLPAVGRAFKPEEDRLGGAVHQVVVSSGLAGQIFGGDPAKALNQVLHLRGEAYTVIGVAPKGFSYPQRTDVWVPLMARYASYKDEWWKLRNWRPHQVIARLSVGVSLAQAQADMDSINARLAEAYPETNRGQSIKVVTLREAEAGEIRPFIVAVAVAVLVLLLIGSLNTANLFLARAASREREMAIRAALGSGFWQMLQTLITESLAYGLPGGTIGVGIAWLGVKALLFLIPEDLPPWMAFRLNPRVLLFALLATLLTSAAFGLVPALSHLRIDLNEILKQGSKGSSEGRTLSQRLKYGLIVFEVALSVLLLIGAGLMLRSFQNLLRVDTGIKPDHLVIATVGRFVPNVTKEAAVAAYSVEFRRIRDRLAEIPGVRLASAGNDVPLLNQPEQRTSFDIYTRARSTRDLAYRGPAQGADVMPHYFEALGIPILRGRDFSEADTLDKPGVVVISEYAAKLLFPGKDPLGQEIRWGNLAEFDPWMRIIGVVGTTKWQPAERDPGVEFYWSYLQFPGPSEHFLLRTSVNPEAIVPVVRRTVQEASPDFSVEHVKTMENVAAEALWRRRLWGVMLGVFATLALLLAAIGIFGVMSYVVSQETREIGIRMAIGAHPWMVLALIVRRGLRLALLGCILGLTAAAVTTRLLTSLLFGVNPLNPVIYAMVPVLLMIAATLACLLPASRASRIDPVNALRQE